MNDFDFDVEEGTTEDAKQVENPNGPVSSKFEPLGEKWENAEEGDAIILRGVSKTQVKSIRTYMYRAFEKEDVIVRSRQQSDGDLRNVTIRAREDGEYLQRNNDEETAENETGETIVDEVDGQAEEMTKDDAVDDMEADGEDVLDDDPFAGDEDPLAEEEPAGDGTMVDEIAGDMDENF